MTAGVRRRGPRELDLSDRDQAILREVGRFRVLTSGQIERLHFAGHHASAVATRRRCQAVLHRLAEHELLDRLERRQGGHRAGSVGFTYRLTTRGRRAIAESGEEGRGGRRQPTGHWTAHTLAVAEVAVGLHEAQRAGRVTDLTVTPEPDTWRRFIGRGGQVAVLKPDLLVEIVTTDRLQLRWFVEVDRSTEHGPVLFAKCQQYQAYWRSGVEDHPVFPRVLWSVPDERRLDFITRLVTRSSGLDPALFAVTTAEQTTAALTGQANHHNEHERR